MERYQYDPYAPRKRPWQLTTAVILIFVQAALQVVGGFLLVADRALDEFTSGISLPTLAAAFSVLLGLFELVIALGVRRGDRVARITATIVLLLDAAIDVYLLSEIRSELAVRALSIVLIVAILVVIWTGRSRRYFVKPRT